jgi:predicted dehydrogenase
MVLAGDVDPAPLRAAGWQLLGALSGLPYDDRLDAATYTSAAELAADPRIDAVALDGEDRELAALLPELRESGLLVLLPSAAPLQPDLVRAALAVRDGADAAVGLLLRWRPWTLTVAAALPLAGSPPVQVTVRGWPRGRQAAAELVDLVAAWCGEVAAVVAAPAVLPAAVLPATASSPEVTVSWALLTAGGATVLVSHDGPAPEVRLSFPTARLEAGPAGVRWEGGAELPLLPLPSWVPSGLPHTAEADPGLIATAAALTRAVGGGDVPATAWPWPADLSDLLVAARVLEALRTSARTEGLVPVG